jgi:hypothetical protein
MARGKVEAESSIISMICTRGSLDKASYSRKSHSNLPTTPPVGPDTNIPFPWTCSDAGDDFVNDLLSQSVCQGP